MTRDDGDRTLVFRGQVIPKRSGQAVTLSRVVGGRESVVGRTRTSTTGRYEIRWPLTSGTHAFLVRTARTSDNEPGVSGGGRPRTVAVP